MLTIYGRRQMIKRNHFHCFQIVFITFTPTWLQHISIQGESYMILLFFGRGIMIWCKKFNFEVAAIPWIFSNEGKIWIWTKTSDIIMNNSLCKFKASFLLERLTLAIWKAAAVEMLKLIQLKRNHDNCILSTTFPHPPWSLSRYLFPLYSGLGVVLPLWSS